jgi:hypothetical protein
MSSAASSSWKSTFTSVPPLTKTIVTAMTVMIALDFAIRFRDLAQFSYSDSESPISNTDTTSDTIDTSTTSTTTTVINQVPNTEETLISLLALIPVS